MSSEAFSTAFQPSQLIYLAIRGHWAALSLAMLGLIALLTVVGSPSRLSKATPLAALAWAIPLYVWALRASLGAMSTFDGLAASHGITTLQLWAAALSHGFALFGVLLPVTASAILACRAFGPLTTISVGPVAAVGAVFADWIFLLLLATPMQ